jgi:DNA polymerase-3 subunit gamma/tau
MLVAGRREPMLHAHLLHSVNLVRFAPGVIELRQHPEAPRDLASKLAALLQEATGTRWTIALSAAQGEPTLAEQGDAARAERHDIAAQHPLVRAIMETFPGARIANVNDSSLDAYGLPPALAGEAAPLTPVDPDERSGDDDIGMPDFAPPDAGFAGDSPDAGFAGHLNEPPTDSWET